MHGDGLSNRPSKAHTHQRGSVCCYNINKTRASSSGKDAAYIYLLTHLDQYGRTRESSGWDEEIEFALVPAPG